MKKTRAISLLLSLSLICAMLVPGAAAFAENESPSDSGMVINKTATANGDGSYTITLEAYATGSKVISEVTEDVPTDIVLVLDQSGSMDDPIGAVSFEPYEDKSYNGYIYDYNTRNQDHYENRHNGGNANLYYPLGNGAYASVSVTVEEDISYEDISNNSNNSYYWSNRNNLYASVSGVKLKVSVSRTDRNGTYTYTLPDGTVIGSADGRNGAPIFTEIDGNHLYLASINANNNVYTYTYTDADGVTQTIGTSTGATTTFDTTLYERVVNTNAGGSRLNAIKTAVTAFANNVATKAAGTDGILGTEDDVNHRIAVVGFASESGYGNNTELLSISGTNSGSVGVAYNSITDQDLKDVVQDMDTAAGQTMVTNAINALAAQGATEVNLGMDMAKRILDANPVGEGKQRNRVVIVFTDGAPTTYDGFSKTVANNAISIASGIKTAGATVYSVGIFSGADPQSAGTEPSGDLNNNSTSIPAASNWFMQNLSSNNGKVQTPSYYLSAADASTLNNIFQQISDNIESGGSSTTLSEETVIKDIIAPAFTLPQGATAANITLETYHCTGENGDAYTWSKNADAMGATATVNDDQVSVTGFDFAENYVGTVTENGNVSYRGHKLVISFNVVPKDGFLGGNAVITNTSAGVYENSDATKPVLTFPQPDVDVAIGDVVINDIETNVYLGGFYSQTIPADQIKAQMTVTVGGVTLDLTAENYGLEAWQTEYVDITVTVKDKDGKDLTGGIESLTEDVEYTVTVTVSPKTETGTATEQSGSGTDTIHVFKPVLTFKDSEVWYGGDAPTDFSSNLQEETWVNSDGTKKHNDTGVQMLNAKPELKLTYAPEDGKIADGKVNTKQDIAVDVAVKIGDTVVTDYTTFNHTNCEGKTCTVPEDKEFLLHVKTCQLTIAKTGGTANEPYVFTVKKDGVEYTEATIVGNGSVTIYELPVGAYTIAEDTGWSWRFTPSYSDDVTLSKDNASGTITCTNTQTLNYWLNGFSEVVTNIFGVKH